MRVFSCVMLNISAVILLSVWCFDPNQLWANAAALFIAIGGLVLGFTEQ